MFNLFKKQVPIQKVVQIVPTKMSEEQITNSNVFKKLLQMQIDYQKNEDYQAICSDKTILELSEFYIKNPEKLKMMSDDMMRRLFVSRAREEDRQIERDLDNSTFCY